MVVFSWVTTSFPIPSLIGIGPTWYWGQYQSTGPRMNFEFDLKFEIVFKLLFIYLVSLTINSTSTCSFSLWSLVTCISNETLVSNKHPYLKSESSIQELQLRNLSIEQEYKIDLMDDQIQNVQGLLICPDCKSDTISKTIWTRKEIYGSNTFRFAEVMQTRND